MVTDCCLEVETDDLKALALDAQRRANYYRVNYCLLFGVWTGKNIVVREEMVPAELALSVRQTFRPSSRVTNGSRR